MRHRLLILAAALLWSTGGAAIKLTQLGGWQVSSGRSLIAALVLLAAVPSARKPLSRKFLGPALAYAATVVLFVLANKKTTAANAIFIQDTAPLWVMLLGPRLLGERATRSELWSAPLFAAGLALFFVGRLSPAQSVGNLLALASGVAFALCIIGLRAAGAQSPAVVMWGNLLAAAVGAPFALLGPAPGAADLGVLAFLGVFQLGLSYVAFGLGLRQVRAAEASLLILLEPVLNPVWAFLVAGERPGPWAIAGGTIVLLATAWRIAASPVEPGT